MKWSLAMLALNCSIATVNAQERDHRSDPSMTLGFGTHSCATWLSDAVSYRDGINWILGDITSLDGFRPDLPSITTITDGQGIVAEVRKLCEQKPSFMLSFAVLAVFSKIKYGK